MTTCAVVGLGVGAQHAMTILARPDCRLKYVCDLDRARLARFRRAHGSVRAARSLDEIVGDPEVSLVCIASFDDAHYRQASACLKRGKHVFVEKPLCRSARELRALASLVSRRGLGLCSNLVLREAPLYAWLKEAIRGGELGEIYAFDGDYLYGRIEKITQGWRRKVPDYSVLAGGGIHLVDLMMELVGARPRTVHSNATKVATRGTPFRYHDFQSSVYTFDGGAIGRITANFGCVHPHQHVVRVFGTKATFIHDDRGARLHRTRKERARAEPIRLAAHPAGKGVLIPGFLEAIRSGRTGPLVRRELDLVAAVLAGDEALRRGRSVRIKYLS